MGLGGGSDTRLGAIITINVVIHHHGAQALNVTIQMPCGYASVRIVGRTICCGKAKSFGFTVTRYNRTMVPLDILQVNLCVLAIALDCPQTTCSLSVLPAARVLWLAVLSCAIRSWVAQSCNAIDLTQCKPTVRIDAQGFSPCFFQLFFDRIAHLGVNVHRVRRRVFFHGDGNTLHKSTRRSTSVDHSGLSWALSFDRSRTAAPTYFYNISIIAFPIMVGMQIILALELL